jgi:restriction system protein
MSRRSSPFEDLMSLAARLQWGISGALAFISFLAFQWLYVDLSTPGPAGSVADLGTVAQRGLWCAIASVLRFVVPAAFVIGAAASLIKSGRAKASFDRVAMHGASAVGRLSWREFETLIGEGFRRQGYTVSGQAGAGPDGGVDLVLVKGAERALVQCKHWRRSSVGVAVIRELYGVMTARSVGIGFVVTSGTFTPEAREFATRCGIELIDGARLNEWVLRAPAAKPDTPARLSEPSVERLEVSIQPSTPACPKCGVDMVLRTVRQGSSAGQRFWGCARFPHCRETRPVG